MSTPPLNSPPYAWIQFWRIVSKEAARGETSKNAHFVREIINMWLMKIKISGYLPFFSQEAHNSY